MTKLFKFNCQHPNILYQCLNVERNKLACPLVLIGTKISDEKIVQTVHQRNKSIRLINMPIRLKELPTNPSRAVLHLQQIVDVFEEIKSVKTVLKEKDNVL